MSAVVNGSSGNGTPNLTLVLGNPSHSGSLSVTGGDRDMDANRSDLRGNSAQMASGDTPCHSVTKLSPVGLEPTTYGLKVRWHQAITRETSEGSD